MTDQNIGPESCEPGHRTNLASALGDCAGMGDDAILQELRGLRAEIRELRRAVAIAALSHKRRGAF
ncbi:hypothetical protein [Aureimonas mangrovi]|uniref:hypothetical protein n=1 Tax=Aureimonas mangrovi TaxID=2758041 RepID=UPI00163D724F|nr:hypothetical protein [Aureimonas mangrovi]